MHRAIATLAVPGRRPWLARLSAGAVTLALAGCGFQLRRTASLPFRRLYLGFAPTSAIGAEFRRRIRVADTTEIVADPKQADARLEVLAERRDRQIVAYSSTGRAREYQLRQHLSFRVLDANSRELLAPTTITLHRDIAASDIEIVSKQQEEELLYREMEGDLVQQLLRRLAAIEPRP